MKPRNRIPKGIAPAASNASALEDLADTASAQVEHVTTFEFLRRAPRHSTADDLTTFGNRVKRAADAIPLPWLPAPHPLLGIVRVYPLPLLEWVYSQFVAQLKWPPLPASLEDQSETRKREATRRQLEIVAADAPADVAQAFAVVMRWLDSEAAKNRPTEPAPAPLRSV